MWFKFDYIFGLTIAKIVDEYFATTMCTQFLLLSVKQNLLYSSKLNLRPF